MSFFDVITSFCSTAIFQEGNWGRERQVRPRLAAINVDVWASEAERSRYGNRKYAYMELDILNGQEPMTIDSCERVIVQFVCAGSSLGWRGLALHI